MDLEKKEKNIVDVGVNNPYEEYYFLEYLFQKKEFFKKNNYSVSIPQDEYFEKLWNSENDFLGFEMTKNEFENKFYKTEIFQNKVKEIQNILPEIEKGIQKIKELKIKDFQFFKNYKIVLTQYGPGGNYNSETGKITRSIYSLKKILDTIIHEIIHIGIEKTWVQNFNLEHWEKEALVDGICKKYFSDILIDYKIQKNIDKNIFDLAQKTELNELYEKIKNIRKKNKK